MPRPTPTAPTSASPPPRGEGPGVGGLAHRPDTNPRPGPEPGPRPTPRTMRQVPGQARDGIAFCLAAHLLPLSATAQIIPTGSPTADILLTTALSEQRVFLTCTALDAANHQTALTFWQGDVAAALALLTERNVPAEAIQAFRAAARPEALMPAPDTPFAEVQEYCAAQENWPQGWQRRDFTELARALPEAMPKARP